eukprot:CAMPEP_0206240236 /NCGR_PEP_ID=MMETSP0047_2-20121206/15829_1 /ASSEMBLY_ACC=CAM_ASM_000192 /TAXON_ID=195065 /ORGANISM="Chroomonas mesostigmatica_cf, Strain CCMP1168" /LENGTH=432 /DNA_ID=CAMNT_0053665001 /DNA_START=12 /DNA_END=1308 /DNA_ORIENTATION=-
MALVEKRPRSPTAGGELVEVKKPKSSALMTMGPERTSSMQSPIMLLQGHGGEVLTFRFDPSGQHCASAGHDKDIFLWEVYGDCSNYAVLRGHKQAVLQLQWQDDQVHLWSCSADKMVMLWDVETGKRVKKFVGHSSFVNSVCPSRKGEQLGVSGSDDGMVLVWDPRQRGAAIEFTDSYQVTAVEFSDDGQTVFSGGLDNEIKVWDMRMGDTTEQWKAAHGHDHGPAAVARRDDAAVQLDGQHDPHVGHSAVLRGGALQGRDARARAQLREVAAALRVGARHGQSVRGVVGPHGAHLGGGYGEAAVQAARAHGLGQRGRLPPDGAHYRVLQLRQKDLSWGDQGRLGFSDKTGGETGAHPDEVAVGQDLLRADACAMGDRGRPIRARSWSENVDNKTSETERAGWSMCPRIWARLPVITGGGNLVHQFGGVRPR